MTGRHADRCLAHLRWFVQHAPLERHGPTDLRCWSSSLDLATGRHPEGDRPAGITQRCYRYIEAPFGSNLYWDLPLLDACVRLGIAGHDADLTAAVRRAIRDYLRAGTAACGLPYWGNHYFLAAVDGAPRWFYGGDTVPEPAGDDHALPWLHELRPLRPRWEVLAAVDPDAVRRCIRAMAEHHVHDPATGAFNRHADARRPRGQVFAFLEAGGILAESCCWAAARMGEMDLVETALGVARFSFGTRDPVTGLVRNQPFVDRWDQGVCTSEVGLWARCLFSCESLTSTATFGDLACGVLAAWLGRAWDEASGAFHGQVRVADGLPAESDPAYPYMPHGHADFWEPLFPAHDYPFACAEACLDAWERTGREVFLLGAERWLGQLERSLPARDGAGGYAEHYGRAIALCRRAAAVLRDERWAELAERIADEAMTFLGVGDDRFRSHPGEDRVDAVDGLGYLLTSLCE